MHNKTRTILIVVLLAAALAAAWFLRPKPAAPPAAIRPTYFAYSAEELAQIEAADSSLTMTSESAFRWDEQAFSLVAGGAKVVSGFDPEPSRIYAYLTMGQREAARLSLNATGRYAGSLDPVSRKVICVFFVESCANLQTLGETDAYSERLADLVLAKIMDRINQSEAAAKPYVLKTGDEYWSGAKVTGLVDGARTPWVMGSTVSFRADPPPAPSDPFWQEETAKVRAARAGVTDAQQIQVIYWSGGPGTKTPTGLWLEIADTKLRASAAPFGTVVELRAITAAAMADANVAAFDTKYTYQTKRPFMLDASIKPLTPTPSSPSYTSGLSALSAAAAAVLSDFYPAEKAAWEAMADEAGVSRQWSGIHFPIDHQAGVLQGRRIAETALRKLK